MIETLVANYEKGAITANHLVAQCLDLIDPKDPGLVLAHLPDDILTLVLQHVRAYQSGRMRTNYGLLPTTEQVETAKQWIEMEMRSCLDPSAAKRQLSQADGSGISSEDVPART